MKAVLGPDSPDGGDLTSIRLSREDQTGVHGHSVENHRACPAVAALAAEFDIGMAHPAQCAKEGFAAFGGRPSDNRLARSGRVDIHVDQEVNGPTVGAHWEIRPA